MRNTKKHSWIILLLVFAMVSCYRAPEFPVKPNISFNRVEFYDVIRTKDNPTAKDSLVITINFEDGDGNLGLSVADLEAPPFHPFYLVTTENKLVISPGNNALLNQHSNDTMPSYNCVDYREGRIKNGVFYPYSSEAYKIAFPEKGSYDGLPPDTFYVKPNIYASNFWVDFMVKNGEKYEVFDWNKASVSGCADAIYGQFPRLSDDGSSGNPLSGELSYTINSLGFIPYFSTDTIKLQVQIIDRSLNKSNIVQSSPFYFVNPGGGPFKIQFLEE